VFVNVDLTICFITETMYAFGNDAFESQQQPAMTMMQRLQMDRRKKIQEHQMRVMKGNIFCIVFYLIALAEGGRWNLLYCILFDKKKKKTASNRNFNIEVTFLSIFY
jgi:hypothetical protein